MIETTDQAISLTHIAYPSGAMHLRRGVRRGAALVSRLSCSLALRSRPDHPRRGEGGGAAARHGSAPARQRPDVAGLAVAHGSQAAGVCQAEPLRVAHRGDELWEAECGGAGGGASPAPTVLPSVDRQHRLDGASRLVRAGEYFCSFPHHLYMGQAVGSIRAGSSFSWSTTWPSRISRSASATSALSCMARLLRRLGGRWTRAPTSSSSTPSSNRPDWCSLETKVSGGSLFVVESQCL